MNLETPKVGFVEAFKLYWTNYVNFKGEVVGVSIGGSCYGISSLRYQRYF